MNDDNHDEQLLQKLGRHAQENQKRDALRPLPDEFQQRMAEQIKSAVSQAQPAEPASRTPVRRGPWLALAASVLAAVGLATVLLLDTTSAPLPGYALEFRGGAQMRSDDDDAPIQLTDKLDIVLRPDVATDETLAVDVFHRVNNQWVRFPVTVQWSDSGAARIRTTLDATPGLAPGRQDFAFVISRERHFPGLTVIDDNIRSEDWQVLRQQFELVP